jgi:hypothetical protein
MKLLTVIGLFLDLVGVVILGVREVRKGAASLRDLKESYPDSFHYDVQQRPWYVRSLLRLGATLGECVPPVTHGVFYRVVRLTRPTVLREPYDAKSNLPSACSRQGKPETLGMGDIPGNWLLLPSGCEP